MDPVGGGVGLPGGIGAACGRGSTGRGSIGGVGASLGRSGMVVFLVRIFKRLAISRIFRSSSVFSFPFPFPFFALSCSIISRFMSLDFLASKNLCWVCSFSSFIRSSRI